MNSIKIDTKKLSENFFKMHCENFAKGGEIVLHSEDGSSKKITSYDDIAQSFPHLSDDFKNQVIEKCQEYQRRLTAWEQSVANFALEDIHPTEDMKRIGFMYINGEISFEQRSEMMKASILTGK